MEDVKHANDMAVAPPGWQAPCFKPKDFSGAAAKASAAALGVSKVPVLPAVAGGESKTLEALDVAWMDDGLWILVNLERFDIFGG